MKFTVTISDFQRALLKTLPAMPRKSTLPVLEHLNFSLKDNTLTIISTDQDITIMSVLEVTGEEDGGVLVPGRRLSEVVKAFGDLGSFEFSTNPENFEIKIRTTTGKFVMKGLNPEEYLDLPELFESEKPVVIINDGVGEVVPGKAHSAYFTGEEISKLCEKTVFAVSKDEYRPAMTGVFFEFNGETVTSVATDSYRLSKVSLTAEKAKYPNDFNVIIPSRSIELMKKADSNVVISFVETMKKITHARFDYEDTVMITRIIDEKFPPYKSVIPQEPKYHVVINQNDLLKAIKRVAIFANTNSNQIKVVFEENTIILTGEDEDSGSQGNETLTCDYTGEPMLIGFNFHYLEEALQNLNSELDNDLIIMSFTEANKPILIRANKEDTNVLMLVMPVRLG